MFDIYDTSTYSEAPDAYAIINGEKIKRKDGTFLTVKELTSFILELENFIKQQYNPSLKLERISIETLLDRISASCNMSEPHQQNQTEKKKDWISDDIKAMVDLEGKPLSRERQGKIQVIRESNFPLLKDFPEEAKKVIKDTFLSCLEKRERTYRIKQAVLDNPYSLNWDSDYFVEYELGVAGTIASIKDDVYNARPGEKIYFKRFEMNDKNICKKCKKLKGTVVLWSDVPLKSNKIKDEYADYAMWDDRFTEKKSKIPLTWCCEWCRGTWIRYYPNI